MSGAALTIDGIELRRITMPLVSPFRTSFGTQHTKEVLLLRVVTSDAEGWGECVAAAEPLYSSEYLDASVDVLRRYFIPAVAAEPVVDAGEVAARLARFHGHRMAKAALEMAVLDAELRTRGQSFGHALGAVRERVACGVSVGIMGSVSELLDAVASYLAAGYVRIKLKVEPGWDLEPVRAVRERFGDDLMLQVDANAAYTREDAGLLARLDEFDLALIEQPLPEEDILGHAQLSTMLTTPICLDESITSVGTAADAIALGACRIINIKAGRVGGYLEARRIHDLCRERDIPVWCGGMVETGLGRAANVALAGLPGFVLPGDTSSSERFFAEDITEPFVVEDGYLTVPTGPGLGVLPIPERLDDVTTSVEWIPCGQLN